MDVRAEIRELLTSRRARLTPEAAGLPADGGNGRVRVHGAEPGSASADALRLLGSFDATAKLPAPAADRTPPRRTAP